MSTRFSFLGLGALFVLLGAASCADDKDLNETPNETPPGEDTGTPPEASPAGTPGIVVTPTTGLKTTEGGGTDKFTIKLANKPTADVTIALSSNNETEGTVDRASVVFTTENWDTEQTVTVTGVDDAKPDGAQSYLIRTAAAVSTDTNYSGLDGDDVAVSNADDDSSGITVTPTTGLKTTEMGDEATFTVKLNTAPKSDVTIALSSSDEKEGVVSPKALVFTTTNWNAPQTVTVAGVDDAVADGTKTYKVITAPAKSADKAYEGVDADDVTLTNIDDESPGIRVTPTTGLTTTESGGTATFTVRLNSKPSGDVTIPLSSSKTAEGTVSPASLVFTADNWNALQTVTITGVDDTAADGNQSYTIVTGVATSSDTGYAGMNADDVAVSNVDDESAGITVTPLTGLVTSESGATAAFTVKLNSKPSGTVTIGLTSSNDKEGTVGPASVTFTTDNWSAPQTVTVTGVDDATTDGAQPYKIITAAATGTDTTGYVGMNPADVSVTNTDNDSPGFAISGAAATTEAGTTSLISVRLNAAPNGTVVIPVASSDTTEGTVSPTSLTFDATNWNALQYITVKGVDDFVADGSQSYSVQLGVVTGADTSGYVGLNPADVSLSNTDNDSAGITVTPTSGLTTSEAGGKATFTVKLNSQPTADVTVPLTSNNTKEGTIDKASLVFTAANWDTAQTVTITGINDDVVDGNAVYTIVTAPATSTDTGYSAFNAADVSVTNTDNDSAGIIVTPTSGLVTTEAGGTATFTIVLTSAPVATVSISLSSSNGNEGSLAVKGVSFDATNWSKAQTVTITGVDDTAPDGPVGYSIITGAAVSTDLVYSGRAVDDVSVTNTDNEVNCTTTVCGASCAEINKKYPTLPSGNYLISNGATKPFTVYCHNMEVAGFPKLDYLNVNAKVNYSLFSGDVQCTTCGDYINYYSKIRFNPTTFTIDTSDKTFAKGSGGTAACYEKYSCTGYNLNYGSAGACQARSGKGAIDLGTNPFVFSDKAFVGGSGYKPGGSVAWSLDRRSAAFDGGGGLCGSWGLHDGSASYPVINQALPLQYSP